MEWRKLRCLGSFWRLIGGSEGEEVGTRRSDEFWGGLKIRGPEGGRSEGSAAAPGDLDMTETDHATGRTEWGGRVGVGNCRHCCHLGGSA